ncbi:DUF4291 family protein [Micromonospora krabiensis]|uniref:DUF4291 domain-containing protein n=1 Tax=Micromonospora krabiensis TaxID=307121 RepID=A0A1C3N1M1_9ACTN|nr:DUF4291 family protein [Micromonospora krabiensis]SBV26441.1 protein of unknown function [Micromonospora krabiensis]
MTVPRHQIRARFDADTVTVYQAYPPEIAEPALAAGRFVAPFRRERMTWIKPSFRLRASPVRVQWDPERSLRFAPLTHRSLQVGLAGEAVRRYVDEWSTALTDVTPTVRAIRARLDVGDDAAAEGLLPAEHPYPLPADVAAVVGADAGESEVARW